MRYERKFRITDSGYESVKHELLSNPAVFSEAYPDRVVNSIYYDDINYTAYNDNLLGKADRVKYRIRWYGTSMDSIEQPVLEKKIKKSLLGTKEYKILNNFSLSQSVPALNDLYQSNQLYPHVLVRYLRTYLESMDGLLRATIDRELNYYNLLDGRLSEQVYSDGAIILEIKYGQEDEAIANNCMQAISYRLTKNSKYVSAMQYYLQ